MATYGFRMVFLSAARCTYQTHLLSCVQNAELTTCLTSVILRGRFLSLQSRSYLDRKKMKHSQIKRLKWWDMKKYLASLQKVHMVEKSSDHPERRDISAQNRERLPETFCPARTSRVRTGSSAKKRATGAIFRLCRQEPQTLLLYFAGVDFRVPLMPWEVKD